MTAKQKANAQRFKKAIAEAKKLRKKNPKLTQAQAVKQAWAILYKTGKVAGAKKTATKKPASKKATAKSYHKDTKSHNVNIKVVSGVGTINDIDRLKQSIKLKEHLENTLITYKTSIPKHRTEHIKTMLKALPQLIKNEKVIINTLKKKIK